MEKKKSEKKRQLSMNPACDFAMFLLKTLGYNFKFNIYLIWLFASLHQTIILCMLILGSLEPILNFASAMGLAKSFDIIPHFFIGFIKFTCLLIRFKKLRELLSYEGFWDMSFCGKEVEVKQMKIYTRVRRTYQILIMNAVFVIAVVYFLPLIRGNEFKMPTLYGVTNRLGPFIYQLMYWLQCLGSIILGFLVEGFDCLVLSNLMFVYCQTMMLKNRLQIILNTKIITNKDEIVLFKNMKQCIILHITILKFLHNFNSAFAIPLLFELIGCITIVCMQIFILTASSKIDFDLTTKCILSIGIYIMNLYMICFASSLATSQLNTVYTAAYDSKWYLSPSRSPRMCKSLILLIQMSQQQVQFKAGGIFNLDMDTFTAVLRLSYSYYTIMKTLS